MQRSNKNEIARLFDAGLPYSEISEKTGWTIPSLRNAVTKLRREGRIASAPRTPGVKPSVALDQKAIDKLVLMVDAGRSYAKISEQIGWTPNNLRAKISRLRRAGIALSRPRPHVQRRRKRLSRLRIDRLVQMVDSGVPYSEICAEFRWSGNSLRSKIAKMRNDGMIVSPLRKPGIKRSG